MKNNISEIEQFWKQVQKYKFIEIGLTYQGEEIKATDYHRIHAPISVKETASKYIASNSETVAFDESETDWGMVDGIILRQSGIEVSHDSPFSRKVTKNTIVTFAKGALQFNYLKDYEKSFWEKFQDLFRQK